MKNTEKNKDIWNTVNNLRGSVDGWEFKNYILGFLFYRYLSENLTNYINKIEHENGDEYFNYALLTDEDAEEIKENLIKEKGFFIYPSQLFENIKKRAELDEGLNITLETIFNEIERSSKGTESEDKFSGIFGDVDLNNKHLGNSIIQRNEKLVRLLDEIGDIDFGNYQDNMIEDFGDVYEYLIPLYAINTGKSGGEYYTPQDVSELLVLLATNDKEEINRVYDPAAGSGSLLLKVANTFGKDKVKDGFYGQEINWSTYNLARMNMLLHDIPVNKFDIALGNTLTEPEHWDDEPFDVIVSNPPYSIKWPGKNDITLVSDDRFSPAGVLAPPSKADLAFIMHCLSYLSSEGTAAIVCFPGVLYRGGAEQKIRKYLIDNNYIDAIIQLPSNLFFGTSISECIMVLKNMKSDDEVLFVDASKYFVKSGNRNKLTQEDIEKIVKIFSERKDIKGVSKLISKKEIQEEDFNLSVSTYVEINDNYSFKNTEKLKDLVKSIEMGSYRTAYSQNAKQKDNTYVININDLNNNLITSTNGLDISSSDNLKKALEPGDIILSRNFNSFKGGLFEIDNSDKEVIATSNSFIIKVNKEKIDPLYLLYILTSPIGRNQMEQRIPNSGMIRSFFAKTLEKLDIPIVDMEKQKEIGKHYLDLLKEEEDLKRSLKEKQKEIDTFAINEIN